MRQFSNYSARAGILELCTFYINDQQFGIDIQKIQEINKNLSITRVPYSSEFIVGVMNLRGRIVTVIDLAKKCRLSDTVQGKNSRAIIVNSQDEYIGLLVDRVGDVIPVNVKNVEPPPVNIDSILGSYTKGVLNTGSDMIGILDVEAVLA